MLGKFAGHFSLKELQRFFPIDEAACEVTADAGAVPSQEIYAIIRDKGLNRLDKFHWGLVPTWAKDASIGKRMINARVETISEKPSFREAFKYRRCLIPADGFYEWTGKAGKKKPVFIALPARKPFAFAGLWEKWINKKDEHLIYQSCTIITTDASESFRPVHHRMPAILRPEVYDTWLDPDNNDVAILKEILKHELITELSSFPVPEQGNTLHSADSGTKAEVSKPRQTTFDWPEREKSPSKG